MRLKFLEEPKDVIIAGRTNVTQKCKVESNLSNEKIYYEWYINDTYIKTSSEDEKGTFTWIYDGSEQIFCKVSNSFGTIRSLTAIIKLACKYSRHVEILKCLYIQLRFIPKES